MVSPTDRSLIARVRETAKSTGVPVSEVIERLFAAYVEGKVSVAPRSGSEARLPEGPEPRPSPRDEEKPTPSPPEPVRVPPPIQPAPEDEPPEPPDSPSAPPPPSPSPPPVREQIPPEPEFQSELMRRMREQG